MSAAVFTGWPEWRLPEHGTDSAVTQGGQVADLADCCPALVFPRIVRITIQESPMRFDYDEHYAAMRGDAVPGPTLDQQRRATRLEELRRLAVALMWTGAVVGVATLAVAVFELMSGRGS